MSSTETTELRGADTTLKKTVLLPRRRDGAPPLDVSKPLVFQVGNLGEDYLEWVHAPVSGAPIFFDGPLELITKTPWFLVPCVWLPVVAWALWRSAAIAKLPAADILSCFLVGLALWQVLEYGIHRVLFHSEPSGYWGITAHFLFHGNHHKFPTDKYRLVFPPVPAGVIIWVIYIGLRAVLPAHVDLAVGSGALFGYVCYDIMHYMFHHSAVLPGAMLKRLKTKHLAHHYKDPNRGYHISGDVMDCLFGTL